MSSPLASVLSAIQSSAAELPEAEVDARINAAIEAHFKTRAHISEAAMFATTASVSELNAKIQRHREEIDADISRSNTKLQRDIEELQRNASAGVGRDEQLQARIDKLTTEHRALMLEAASRKEVLEQQAHINAHPELRVFYRVFQSKIGDVFLALKVIASGLVTREKAMSETAITSGEPAICFGFTIASFRN